MIVGWGEKNFTTVTNGILANELSLKWETKKRDSKANYNSSLAFCSTIYLGQDENGTNILPLQIFIPMVVTNEIVIGGWDISKLNIFEAAKRARVLEPIIYMQLKEQTEKIIPLPNFFDLYFVALNQKSRIENAIYKNKEK